MGIGSFHIPEDAAPVRVSAAEGEIRGVIAIVSRGFVEEPEREVVARSLGHVYRGPVAIVSPRIPEDAQGEVCAASLDRPDPLVSVVSPLVGEDSDPVSVPATLTEHTAAVEVVPLAVRQDAYPARQGVAVHIVRPLPEPEPLTEGGVVFLGL